VIDEPAGPANRLTYEAIWPSDLFTQGVGWVIFTRFKSAGRRAETGVFLIDVFCLGAKFAVYEAGSTEDYRQRIRAHYVDQFPMVSAEPCCARKLVEQAAEYALRLGFAPHPDYRKTSRVFAGVQTCRCQQGYTFGCQGKPFYRRGPRETEARARSIIRQLQQRCGSGNFEYHVMLGSADQINQSPFGPPLTCCARRWL